MVFKIRIKVNEDIHLFELEPTKKIIDLKNAIKEKFSWDKSVDLFYEDEVPIRSLGKYNINKGVFLEIYDQFELDNFNFASRREFYLLAKQVDKKLVQKKKKTDTNNKKGKYIAPNKRNKQDYQAEKQFVLNSDDFPPLGS